MEILLLLQKFRESTNGLLTPFFQMATFFGEVDTILILLAVVYWCIDKKTGKYLMTGWCWNRLINGFLKVQFCIYRPWILDSRIVPDASAITTATGYSFPSGHSMNAGSFYGGIAIKKDTNKILKVLCIIIILCIGFSRLYLGVHAPLDVLVGLISSIIVMYICKWVLNKTKDSKNADIIISVICILIGVVVAIYATHKSYPIDYDSEGKIVVEGIKMASDTFKGIGWNIGFFVGSVIERRFVGFTSDGTTQQRCTRLVGGLFGFYVLNLIINNVIKLFISGNVASLITHLLQMIYIVLIFPLIISFVQKKRKL